MGNIPGMVMSKGSKEANHLQFANDTLLMGGSSSIYIAIQFKYVINVYTNAYGGSENKGKGCLCGWNISDTHVQNLDKLLWFSYETSWHSFKYLGIPLLIGNENSSDWNGILDKFIKNLT